MRDVSATAADRINTELGLAIIGMRPAHEAVSRVETILRSGRHARTVARTEVARAYAVAGQRRMEQASGVLPGPVKEWRCSGKFHSRPLHDAADGQRRPVDEPFGSDGVELRFPVYPTGPPARRPTADASLSRRWRVGKPDRPSARHLSEAPDEDSAPTAMP